MIDKQKRPLYVIVALHTALVLFRIQFEDLWYDEIASLWYDDSLWITIRNSLAVHNHPPLYFASLWIWRRVFGYSVFSLRMYSALFSIATIPCIYSIAQTIHNSKKTATHAAFLAAISIAVIYFGQEVRAYSMLLFFSTFTIALLLNICLRHSTSRAVFIAYIGGIIACIYTHAYGLAVAGAQGLFVVLMWRTISHTTKKKLRCGMLLIVCTSIPLMIVYFFSTAAQRIIVDASWTHPTVSIHHVPLYVFFLKGIDGLGLRWFHGVLYTALWISFLIAVARRIAGKQGVGVRTPQLAVTPRSPDGWARRTIHNVQHRIKYIILTNRHIVSGYSLLLLHYSMVLVIPFLISINPPAFVHIRYTMPAIVVPIIVGAKGLASIRYKGVRYAMILLVGISATLSLEQYYTHYIKPQYRNAFNYILENRSPTDQIYYGTPDTKEWYARATDYYINHHYQQLFGTYLFDAHDDNSIIQSHPPSSPTVWYLAAPRTAPMSPSTDLFLFHALNNGYCEHARYEQFGGIYLLQLTTTCDQAHHN